MVSILEFSKTSLQLQVESKKILKQLYQKEISVKEFSQIIHFLEQITLTPKDVKKIIFLGKKYLLKTNLLEKGCKTYHTQEKCIPSFKQQLKKIGLKEITILPNLIHARGKENAYIYIHIRKHPTVNGFPLGEVYSDIFIEYTEELEKKLKLLIK